VVGQISQFILNVFRFHKLKILATLVSSLLFLVFMFPYDDLSEVISAEVSRLSANQVFLQFDNLGLQVVPFPALAIENVTVESTQFPSLEASRLALAPSILGYITFRPGYKVGATGLWDGDAQLNFKTGSKNSQGARMDYIELEIDKIDLSKMAEMAGFPIRVQGKASADIDGKFDAAFAAQPEGDIQVFLNEPRFSPGSIPTQMGPLSLPGLSWKDVVVKGRLVNSKFLIDEFRLGESKDLLNGTVKGEIELRIQPSGAGHISPQFGSYNLIVDLYVNSRLEKDLSAPLIFLSNFKSPTTTGSRFRFQLSAARMGVPPTISAATAQ